MLPIILDVERTVLTSLSAEALGAFLREVSSAVKKLGIYPPGHPASIRAAEKPFALLKELIQEGGPLIFAIADGKLIGNGVPLEDKLINEGLGRTLDESGLSSVSFQQNVLFDEFEKFLSHLKIKKEQRDLQGFLEKEGIRSIIVGKLQYQLVGEDEKVVSADTPETLVGGSVGDIQLTMADALRKYPGLLLKILAGQKGFGGQGPIAVGTGSGGGELSTGSGGGSGLRWLAGGAGGGSEGLTSDIDIDLRDRSAVMKSLSAYTDEELLSLMVAALRESLGERTNVGRFEISNTLFALREVLAEKEALDLLPKLKESVGDLNMVDPKYLDLILSADSSPRKVAHAEVQNFKSDFLAGDVTSEKVTEAYGWLETINEKPYTQDVIERIYEGLEEHQFSLTEAQLSGLMQFAHLGAEHPDSHLAVCQLQEIKDRMIDPAITYPEFCLLSDQLEIYFQKYVENGRFEEANNMLQLINQKLDDEIIYEEGVSDYAAKTQQRMTSAHTTEMLVAKLGRSFDTISKQIVPLLENCNSLESILVLASYVSHENRGLRILLIRILSGFGEKTIAAFRLMLSDKSLTARPAGKHELPLESWYKLRNIIYILGNIPHPDAIATIRPFADDRDDRVVMEVLTALEKLGGSESARIAASLLGHNSREIQQKALHALTQIGTEVEYLYVESFFLRNLNERSNILPTLIKLDRQRALNFLASVLAGESDAYDRLYAKPDEGLNELIVRTFIQLRSVILDDVLKRYVKINTRSLFGSLRKPNSVKLAERYLRTHAE